MHRPREGVRVLEVAQFALVRAAGAVLAVWGADVIRVKHLERGDAQRGLIRLPVFLTNFHGGAITAFRRNTQTTEPAKGYSIAATTDRQHASMRIPSASSLPNEGCRYG